MEEKKRGGCLTAWLIFMLTANSLLALYYLVYLSGVGLPLLDVPQWAIYILTVGTILNVVFAVAIVRWKKWGLYGFAAITKVFLSR